MHIGLLCMGVDSQSSFREQVGQPCGMFAILRRGSSITQRTLQLAGSKQ